MVKPTNTSDKERSWEEGPGSTQDAQLAFTESQDRGEKKKREEGLA